MKRLLIALALISLLILPANAGRVVTIFGSGGGGGVSTPTFVNSDSGQGAGTTYVTVNKPSGTAEGDLMIVFMGVYTDPGVSPPSSAGWTEFAWSPVVSSGSDVYTYFFYKVAGSSEPSTWDFLADGRVLGQDVGARPRRGA